MTNTEPSISISFNATELQTLAALIDVAVKATGIQGAKQAVPLMAKLEAAVAQFNQSQPTISTEEAEAA